MVREFDRKPDQSRSILFCAFGPLLPFVFFLASETISIFTKEEPHGFEVDVGGLPYSATESQLNDLFATHGTVESARIITDKFTGQSRGFGFVEMSSSEEAQAAISAVNGTQMDGRTLTVNEAKPQEPRSGGGRLVEVVVVAAVAVVTAVDGAASKSFA